MSEHLSYGALARIFQEPSSDKRQLVNLILQVLSVEPSFHRSFHRSSSSRFFKYLESYLSLKLISIVQVRATAEWWTQLLFLASYVEERTTTRSRASSVLTDQDQGDAHQQDEGGGLDLWVGQARVTSGKDRRPSTDNLFNLCFAAFAGTLP